MSKLVAMATNKPNEELMDYYKKRIGDFENERQMFLERLQQCAEEKENLHRLEWENRKRAEEIRELQKALSDAQQSLFEGSQRVLVLQAENDELRLQEMQDRQRIQQLLGMAPPHEQEIIYGPHGPPSTITHHPRRPVAGTNGPAGRAGGGQERVLRTVFMPTVDTEQLQLKVESLQAQLNEQKQLYSERIAALMDDRKIREQEEQKHWANMNMQIDSLSQRLKKTEEALRITTRDYILARREKQEAERRAAEVEAAAAHQGTLRENEIASLKQKSCEELERCRKGAATKLQEYTAKLREQVKSREDELLSLSAVHTSVRTQYEKLTADLEARCQRLQDQNRQLEQRRALDMEGFSTDVTTLRKMIAAVDRKVVQVRLADRLEDRDRLDTLLAKLQVQAPSAILDHPPDKGSTRLKDKKKIVQVFDVANCDLEGPMRMAQEQMRQMERKLKKKKKNFDKM